MIAYRRFRFIEASLSWAYEGRRCVDFGLPYRPGWAHATERFCRQSVVGIGLMHFHVH